MLVRFVNQGKREVYLRHQKKLAFKSAVQRKEKRARKAARYRNPAKLVYEPRIDRKVRYFPCPKALNLSRNYDETIKFLMNFRRWGDGARRSNFYVDLRPLQEISPAGALLLVAEFYRWVKIHRKRIKAFDAVDWDPSVRKLLHDMGFFSLLSIPNRSELDADISNAQGNMVFMPFYVSSSADGSQFEKLRDLIEEKVGRIKSRLVLFQGVSEAMTNVVHHAYPERVRFNCWWMSASINFDSSTITVMILDHGVGIPRTLPRKAKLELVRNFLKVATLDGFSDDARMIEAAIALGRSSTGQVNRGHGLYRDIQKYVRDSSGNSRLRIHSNRGSYIYSKSSDGSSRSDLNNFAASLEGTFVEWKFKIPVESLEQK